MRAKYPGQRADVARLQAQVSALAGRLREDNAVRMREMEDVRRRTVEEQTRQERQAPSPLVANLKNGVQAPKGSTPAPSGSTPSPREPTPAPAPPRGILKHAPAPPHGILRNSTPAPLPSPVQQYFSDIAVPRGGQYSPPRRPYNTPLPSPPYQVPAEAYRYVHNIIHESLPMLPVSPTSPAAMPRRHSTARDPWMAAPPSPPLITGARRIPILPTKANRDDWWSQVFESDRESTQLPEPSK